jgi:hypothetical protein
MPPPDQVGRSGWGIEHIYELTLYEKSDELFVVETPVRYPV